MSPSMTGELKVDVTESNVSTFESWDAAIAYAGQLMGGPVTVKIQGESTIYRITSDGRKRALCHV
jgi:hypothetical protein